MDGIQERLKQSVQLRLAWALSLAILLVAAGGALVALVSAFDEAHEFQDDMLHEVAALVERQPHWSSGAAMPAARESDSASDSRLYVQVSQAGAGVETASLPVPAGLADGLHTLAIGDDTYRVLVRSRADGARVVVAQETDERDDIATDSAMRTLLPCLFLLPLVPLLVIYLVRKMFRPIATLAAELDARPPDALHALDERALPVEIKPFAVSMNRLLARVAASTAAQRRFVADAAHELRSPLAALSLQADRLFDHMANPMAGHMADHGGAQDSPAREGLARLRGGIARARHLLDQLLTLAKAQSGPAAGASAPASVSLRQTCLSVLETVLPLAEAKAIDIGIAGMAASGTTAPADDDADARVALSELELVTLVGNLVDNAIRYTPPHGRIDLIIWRAGARALLAVADSGPGIPAAERARVFDPFYRVLGSGQDGSGLGLAIVHAIAARAGASVELGENPGGAGLRVTVSLPLASGQP